MSGSDERAKELRREDIPKWMRVDDDGHIWTTHGPYGRPCEERTADSPHHSGYLHAYIHGFRQMNSHRIVYAWFHGVCPAGVLVRHLNDVKTDNRPANLALGTTADNATDSFKNGGRDNRGTANPRAKLTEADVVAIRVASAAGEKHYKIAERYGVTDVSIAYIVSRKTWAHVA